MDLEPPPRLRLDDSVNLNVSDPSLETSCNEGAAFNPSNRLLSRKFIESTLSKLLGYGVRIGSLHPYQLAFVHKSVYRKDIAPPREVVRQYLETTGQAFVPLEDAEPPVGTFRPASETDPTQSKPLIFVDTYEAMEFAGDGWINACVGQYVKDRFPGQQEGFLHDMKTHVISKDGLKDLSRNLGFGQYALISMEAEESMTRQNESLLEDIFEAFCAAVVEDLGVGLLRVIVKNAIESVIDFREAIVNENNFKRGLASLCADSGWPSPQYVDLGDNAMHGAKRRFNFAVLLPKEVREMGLEPQHATDRNGKQYEVWATGIANRRKKAQATAAYNAIKRLERLLTSRENADEDI